MSDHCLFCESDLCDADLDLVEGEWEVETEVEAGRPFCNSRFSHSALFESEKDTLDATWSAVFGL